MKNWYLIIKCTPLDDDFETDADRRPVCMTSNFSKYFEKDRYEIYKVLPNGKFKIIQKFEY